MKFQKGITLVSLVITIIILLIIAGIGIGTGINSTRVIKGQQTYSRIKYGSACYIGTVYKISDNKKCKLFSWK